MTAPRHQSFTEFWPYYISEHRDPRCRWLHFVGTGGFLSVASICLFSSPLTFGPALLATVALCFGVQRFEAKRNAAPALLIALPLLALANPLVLAGVVGAYGCAWIGHFVIEKNRPATFQYTLWSLAGDFRMFGRMLRGQLWTGDGSEIAPLAPTPDAAS